MGFKVAWRTDPNNVVTVGFQFHTEPRVQFKQESVTHTSVNLGLPDVLHANDHVLSLSLPSFCCAGAKMKYLG